MSLTPKRSKVLFLPVVRGQYDPSLTTGAREALQRVAGELKVEGIFPADGIGDDGLLSGHEHTRQYWRQWRGDLSDIKALFVFSGDFMQERVVMDTARLLPQDVPVFLMVSNDEPSAVAEGPFGDSLCGSLSVLHNLRMIGRPAVASCRVDMEHLPTLRRFLGRYLRIADAVERLRGMRVAAIGVNPDVFATTFSNQMELFRLGFSLHTYELLDLWGDVFVGGMLEEDASECEVPFGSLNPSHPIRRADERLPEIRRIMAGAGCALPADEDVLDALARCLLWLKSTFERDGIDTGAIHCWPQVRRYFPFGYPCGLAMLSNALLDVPLVCEGDLCHAIVAKVASVLSGEPGVILDVNNNGWDPRVFYAFHCSQTPPNWLVGGGQVTPGGFVTGRIAPVPFTGISAATSADAFRATVFSGHFLRQDVGERGSSAWAFVPNFPDVLRAIEGGGIHHFVAMKGDLAEEATEALRFRGVAVEDLSRPVGSLEEIEAELPPMEGGKGQCRVYSQ